MGVPKFYRWISERYPCLSSLIKEDEIPKFDNFYLDMNGIIHHCSHPNDNDINFTITEEEIFVNVFSYIEVLFSFIRPQRVLYLAIDGVAPRAKMNQQRGRRFRSAREAHEQMLLAMKQGKDVPPRFDSNCITPGTSFMERLDAHLQYFIARKVSTDPTWRNVTIFYSSHLVPGEGEHKIMDYIRFIRSQKHYNPYTRHCLYGLDADLIMLGLSVHEPFMSLLREEVKFGKSSTKAAETNPEKINFHLLHLSVLRDYLGHEFEKVKENLRFPFDVEKIIDDWILLGFLVGNDFIPHLPGFHINKKAFDDIYAMYMQVLPLMGGYINEGGYLQLGRFQILLDALEKVDLDKLEEELDNFSWMETKKGGDIARDLGNVSLWDDAGPEEFKFEKLPPSDEPREEDPDVLRKQKIFEFKEKYYKDKLRMVVVNEFYPYNFAPYISDLKNFASLDPEFSLGQPFLPFEQLMAVLPARSKQCLPLCFHYLFGPSSPIYDFYPEDFATDMEGKSNEWEAVVLVPFIEEDRLVAAVQQLYNKLTQGEKRRNSIGVGLTFRYSSKPQNAAFEPPSGKYGAIQPLFTQLQRYAYNLHCLPREGIRKGRHPALQGELYVPGFPTLGFVPHTAELKNASVQVFQRRAIGASMVLNVQKDPTVDYLEQGIALLGMRSFVNWPHHTQAIITKVTDGYQKFMVPQSRSMSTGIWEKGSLSFQQGVLEDEELSLYENDVSEVANKLRSRDAIYLDETDVIYYARTCVGRRYMLRKDGRVAYLELQWSAQEIPFPAQLVTAAPPQTEDKPRITVEQLFPINGRAFVLGFPYYGCMGQVIGHDRTHGAVEVVFDSPAEPFLDRIANREEEISARYEPAFQAARVLGMNAQIVSRITGTVFAKLTAESSEKENIGLSLKATKANTEMRGYTKRVEQEDKPGDFTWLYSDRVLDLVHNYRMKFPELFRYWSDNGCQDPVLEDIYPDEAKPKLEEIKQYLTTLPTHKMSQHACGGDFLDEYIIQAIEDQLAFVKRIKKKEPTRFRTFIHPRLLYRFTEETYGTLPDATVTWEVYDRVIYAQEGGVVPTGLRGTVIAIGASGPKGGSYLTVLFDESFAAGDHASKILEVPAITLLNLTYGTRKQQENERTFGTRYFLRTQVVA